MSSRFLRRLGAAAAVAIVGTLLTPATAGATEPMITVDLCQPTGTVSKISFPASSPMGVAYLKGDAVAIQGNSGNLLNANGQGTATDNVLPINGNFDGSNQGGNVPLCMVINKGASDKSTPQSAWRFCTDESHYACTNKSATAVTKNGTGNPVGFDKTNLSKLSDAQITQIGYLLGAWPHSTSLERRQLQLQVWCISDGYTPGAVAGGAASYLDLTDTAAICLDSDTLASMAHATVSGSAADLDITGVATNPANPLVGDILTFTIKQSYGSPVTVQPSSNATIVACTAPNAALSTATDGSVSVTVAGPASDGTFSATVCAQVTDSGAASLSATSSYITPDQITWYYHGMYGDTTNCQVFADYSQGSTGSKSALAEFAGQYTPVIPADVTSTDPCGRANDGYTIPKDQDGVAYYLLNRETPLEPGFHPVTEADSVTIVARATGDPYQFDKDYSWTFTFTNAACSTNPPSNPPTSTNPPATTEPPATTTETTDVSGTSSVDATTPTTSIAVEGESSTKSPSTTVEVQDEQQTEGDLASTGISGSTWMLAVGGALLIGMGALLARTRRGGRAH